jgi:primosomal protein N' (replication factor Y)
MYYRVIPFKRTFDTYGLIYNAPKELFSDIAPGKIVIVPFRDTEELALCVSEVAESELNCETENIKNIISVFWDFIFLEKRQLELINYVSRHYITPIHHALWLYFPRNLIEKIAKNTLDKIKISEYVYTESEIKLSKTQTDIYNKITWSTQNKHLLYWVTWSGKTQIYMKIIEDNLKEWKQTLLLIPEIILTSQIGERVKEVFWEDVIILHSGVTAAKKSKYWMDIHKWNAKIIIGTRSSLFYPYNKLWAIIIDEEHDSSYISDQAPRYHSLGVAEKISELYKIPLVLWSWTPRTTTLYRWMQWEFQVLQLLEKYK